MGKTAEELKQKIDSMFSQIKNFWPDIDQANPALKDDLYNGLRGKSEYASEIEKGMYCDEHGTNCQSVTAEDIVNDGTAAIDQIHRMRNKLNNTLKAVQDKPV
jgi:hypothetical protein